MTLYKIFKENEERFIRENDNGFTTPTFGDIDRIRDFHLAIIDGIIAGYDERLSELYEQAKLIKDKHNLLAEFRIASITIKHLKDKLLAERKLIEENK